MSASVIQQLYAQSCVSVAKRYPKLSVHAVGLNNARRTITSHPKHERETRKQTAEKERGYKCSKHFMKFLGGLIKLQLA